MGVSGTVAAVVAGWFVCTGLMQFSPVPIAILLGVVMTAFTVTAFELVIYFWSLPGRKIIIEAKWAWLKRALNQPVPKKRGRHQFRIGKENKGFAILFAVLWLVVEVYTFKSSVAGFYGEYAKTKASSVDQVALELLKRQETALAASRKQVDSQIEADQRLITLVSASIETKDQNPVTFRQAQERLAANRAWVAQNDANMAALITQETKLSLSGVKEKTPAFEQWLAGVTGWSADWLQLLEAMLPAMFIDLIASIGLAVALFLRD